MGAIIKIDMNKEITKKEKAILKILKQEENDLPSFRTMRKILAGQYGWFLKSNNSLTQYYKQLAKKGYIKKIPYQIKLISKQLLK